MGGPGSGSHYHWWRPPRKEVVEGCLSVDANEWTREGILKAGLRASGSWRWPSWGEGGFSVHYQVNTMRPSRPSVRLRHPRLGGVAGQEGWMDYSVSLEATPPRFGGLRWWFVCGLIVEDRACNRRVGKLYLPP